MEVTVTPPTGTPTWIALRVTDRQAAIDFYTSLFDWDCEVTGVDTGHYTVCRLRGRRVAGIATVSDSAEAGTHWDVSVSTADCDGSLQGAVDLGGSSVAAPAEVGELGRYALVRDPAGAWFGLWQGRTSAGCELVNEPNTLVRNDYISRDPGPAREYYAALFDYAVEQNADVPERDFTFLRRPDGHEIGGVFGDPTAAEAHWNTTFEVASADDAVRRARATGGKATDAEDTIYGRIANVTDPAGVEFAVVERNCPKARGETSTPTT